jgi:hypothetical protein
LDFCLLIQSYGTFLKLYITANKTKWSNNNCRKLELCKSYILTRRTAYIIPVPTFISALWPSNRRLVSIRGRN